VSESSIKRWADEGSIRVSRTRGGHRRIQMSEAIRYIRTSGLPLQRPELLGLGDLRAVDFMNPGVHEASTPLLEFLFSGKAEESRGLVLALYLGGASVVEIIDGPVRSALEKSGSEGYGNSGEEAGNRAGEICIQALTQLRFLLPEPSDAPYALGGAMQGDTCTLPSLAVAVALRSLGYKVVNLGPDASLAAMVQAARALSPRFVWLTCTSPNPVTPSDEDMASFDRDIRDLDCGLFLYGAHTDRAILPRPADGVFTRLPQIAEAAHARLAMPTADAADGGDRTLS